MSRVLYISEADLQDDLVLQYIRCQEEQENYWNDQWSPSLYARLAYEGLISITVPDPERDRDVLFSQMQKSYALLDWPDLHISRHVRRLLDSGRNEGLRLRVSEDILPVVLALRTYHSNCWLTGEYGDLLQRVQKEPTLPCRLYAVELLEGDELIAGELGYTVGSVYTSLSGFSSREKGRANYGTLQLVLLARLLQKRGVAFWNMGHPYMEYKTRLGGVITPRPAFLKRWLEARDGQSPVLDGLYSPSDLSSDGAGVPV